MSKPGFDQHGPLLEEPRSRPWLTLGLGPPGRGRLGTFRAGFESAGRPRGLAGDRWFRLGARIRKPLKFRVVTWIVQTRERSRTWASSQVRYSVDSDRTNL